MRWKIRPKAPEDFLIRFPEFSRLVCQLLFNRGLESQVQVDEFFNPDYGRDLHDPFLLSGMKKATRRIFGALRKRERIVVYGDFDADGVCAAAIVYLTLKKLGAQDPFCYIPDREKESHGLNSEAVQYLKEKNANLIITVDCGVCDCQPVMLAKDLGLDTIVTDHHQPTGALPKAVSVVNPLIERDGYPFKQLAGAGVAYKLACALLSDKNCSLPLKERRAFKKWLLDLAALATVADVMPMLGENRTIVKYGLGVMAQTRWLGLAELMKLVKINPEVKAPMTSGQAPETNLNSYTLGFVLGPRLNAAGRMDHADTAFCLLVCEDCVKAAALAKKIDQSNTLRQSKTEQLMQDIRQRIGERLGGQARPKLIFEGSASWPVGLLGLAAGKIKDQYQCPAVIYHENENTVTASCRSIDNERFDLVDALKQCAEFFVDFGGHGPTGGFRMKKEHLGKVRSMLTELVERGLAGEDLTPALEIDAELGLADITFENYNQIQLFAPFGRGNNEPKFAARGLEVADLRKVGNGNSHLKMDLLMFDQRGSSVKNFKAIGFGLGNWAEKLKRGDLIDVAFELIINEWNGWRDLEMKIIDIIQL